MSSSNDNHAKFENPLVISAIDNLASAVHSALYLIKTGYIADGAPVTEDLDTLASILLNQIVSCVPREKQISILIAHGLEEYCDDLNECWTKYVLLASADDCIL